MQSDLTTPPQLANELGVSPKRIREFLRQRYGVLPIGQTRWLLNRDQADLVRAHFL